MPTFHLATFSSDVTPPEGHPLCGGWIEPARAVDDPLKLLGVVLLGAGKPVVLAVIDWCAVRNEAYWTWRSALADAAHTTPDHVAVHCVHQHNAPFADVDAEKMIAAVNGPSSLDLKFYGRAVKASAEALRKSLAKTRPFTHLGFGKAEVKEVASNRRVIGPDGKVKYTRTSATKNKAARDMPEGLIDPFLRTLSLWDGSTPLAALHFYATHPMSYYGDGRVSSDFCGLARQKRQDEQPDVFQAYFTGCAGNVTAGKYNDGAKETRPVLRDRIYAGMVEAWKATKTFPVTGWDWRVEPVTFAPRKEPSFSEEQSRKALDDPKQPAARRNNGAFQLAWLKRIATPIEFTSLDFAGKLKTLHLPGEPFIEYQLLAQKIAGETPVCVAGYGDDGTGYIPVESAFTEGGYEPTVALASTDSEKLMTGAIRKLLKP
jgi:hypothetical protein